ncbi:MAG: ATP-binding protein [Leptolyngbyaceae cyanobacterium]
MNRDVQGKRTRQKLPLRMVLVVPFLLQLVGAVSLVSYLSWRSGQQAVSELAFSLMDKTSDRIEADLADHVNQARIVNDINAEAIAQDMLNLDDHDALNQYFLRQLRTFDGLTVVYWSTEEGEYVGAEHRPDGAYGLGITDARTNWNMEIRGIDEQNQPAELIHEAPYDPRERPWYQDAVKAGQPIWTDIFVWAPLTNMSIDLVQPVYDQGELQGVLGISVGLLDASSFLREIKLGETGKTYIVEPATGLLVATSGEQDPFILGEDSSTAEQLPINSDQLPWLNASTQFLEARLGSLEELSKPYRQRFEIDGEFYFLQATPLENSVGLDWMLIAVVPESDYTAQLIASTCRTLALSLGTLLVATGVGILTARWISRPIAQMNQAARELSEDRWHNPAIAPSRIREVEELTGSFRRMATALQESFGLLERKVNERTAELAESNEQLEAAKEKAEAANLTKSRFIANMSHELRTPLNAILGFTQLMHRDHQASQSQRQHLDIIGRSGEHLLNLINDVLTISKIEAGHATVNLVPFDLHRLLQTLEDLFRIKADKKGLSLTFESSPALPRYLRADVGKLRQVLMNLLSNAIKFTQHGSVVVRTTVLRVEHGSQEFPSADLFWLRFDVEDSGPGISPEQLEYLFEAFVQAEAGHRSQEGTGLGLAICREYVQMMGGCIEGMANQPVGALFRIDLPMQQSQCDKAEQAIKRVVRLAPHQPASRILVVDDQLTARQLLDELLSSVGFQVKTVKNGAEAVSCYRHWQPHLIYMDMSMPVMDGYEATRQIRELETKETVPKPFQQPTSPTKIIALTASAFEEDRSRMIAAGCDDFVRKPFQEQEIFDAIAHHLSVKYGYETQETQEQSQCPASSTLQSLPADWIKTFQQAAIQADRDWLIQLVEQIPPNQAVSKERLTQLINQFDFDALVELTERETHAEIHYANLQS